jgi:hypothetical protein
MSDAALDGDEKRFQSYRAEFLDHCGSPHGRMYLPAAEAIAGGIERDFFDSARR